VTVTRNINDIVLTDVHDNLTVSGRDQDGRLWIEVLLMVFEEDDDGLCPVCKEPLTSGWLLLDGSGTQICGRHVTIRDPKRPPRAEVTAEDVIRAMHGITPGLLSGSERQEFRDLLARGERPSDVLRWVRLMVEDNRDILKSKEGDQ
jgi:hypothetical protein